MDPVFPAAALTPRSTHHHGDNSGPFGCPEPDSSPSLRTAARRLASIHDGILGQSIPSEVMEFYKTIKGGDKFRSRMTKEVVLGIEEAILAGNMDHSAIEAIVRARVEASVAKLSQRHLEGWLRARPARERFMPGNQINRIDRLRGRYVGEAMEVFEDALDYVEALARS
jgi:hypothetical protein